MKPESREAILTLALFAAYADGIKDDREREQIRQLSRALTDTEGGPDLARIYQDVLLQRTTVEAAAATLQEPGERQLAYEMAVGMCEVDGRPTEAEQAFLARLRTLLQLPEPLARQIEGEANSVVELSESVIPASPAVPPILPQTPPLSEPDLDRTILRYAVLAGALELLPQSWASMAILPVQLKLVYEVGRAYGYSLDRGHIREFLATVGVGLTSQYLERLGRKLVAGLLGKVAGKAGATVGAVATGVGFSFATTYALGQLAKRYYGGGRRMSAATLRETFEGLLQQARPWQDRHIPTMQQEARTLDVPRLMSLLRGA